MKNVEKLSNIDLTFAFQEKQRKLKIVIERISA